LNRRSQAQQAENQRLRQENERLKAQLQESETLRTQLRATENQLVAQQEATQSAQSDLEATRRRLQEQKPAAAKPETRVIVEKDPSSARLEVELREKEAQLAAQQRRLAEMTDSVSRERQAMQRELAATQADLEAARRKLRQEQAAASKPPAPEREPQIVVQKDADSARLEAELREKEAQLKSQQRKLADMTQSMKRERQTMRKQLEASRRAAEKAQAAPSAKALGQANSRLTELETKLAAKTEDYQKKSASLTGLLTSAGTGDAEKSRAEIDTLKQSLQADAREIAGLREQIDAQNRKVSDLEKQGTVLAAAGPDIQILEPPVNQTRGVPAIQLGSGMREITGRIAAPDGVASFQVENQPVAVDAAGAFRIPVQDDWLGRAIKLSASDKKNRSSVLSLSLLSPDGAAAPVSAAAPTAPLPVSAKSGQFGGFYALIIGNNDYASYQDLKTPASDAKSIDVVLRERYGFKTKVLLNANRYAIMTALNDLKGQLTENDNLLIYYAGHGEIDPGTQTAYWLPTDAETGNRANWISSESITEFISIMPARHIMVIADSCYSGAMAGSAVAKLPDGIDESKRDKWLNVMASRKSRTVLTSGDVKPVLDTGSGDHSVFAQAFLKVLRSNQGILEDYRLYGEVLGPVQSGASKAGFSQTPQYAPIQHAGHEGSPFFFVPAG
jgi:hypothetical protein